MRYSWIFKTEIRSLEGPVRITEFGVFYQDRGHWVLGNFTGQPFTASEFEDWYSCPDAIVQPGEAYADEANWSGGERLRSSETLWYFIGIDADGRKVKGTAIVEELAQLQPGS
jgi:hypothetical protein